MSTVNSAMISAQVPGLPGRVASRDGTAIAYERLGAGPPLILVDGALCSRAFGPMPKLAPLLAGHFTVYMYDRRGRGESGDGSTLAKEGEIEDLAALIHAAGGAAALVGLSSGAALALEAAAAGLPVTSRHTSSPTVRFAAASIFAACRSCSRAATEAAR